MSSGKKRYETEVPYQVGSDPLQYASNRLFLETERARRRNAEDEDYEENPSLLQRALIWFCDKILKERE